METSHISPDVAGSEPIDDREPWYAEIAVPRPLPQTFTYVVPDELRDRIAVGSQVEVPFGRSRSPGFVVSLVRGGAAPREGLKPIGTLTYPDPVFDGAILELAKWVSEYYVASLGEVLMTALPGGLRKEARRASPPPEARGLGLAQIPRSLSAAQRKALAVVDDAITAQVFRSFLLYGVTGSGKTEVYVRAAETAVAAGGQVLMLVPEIALSFQVVERFRLAFGDRVGVFHSGLTARRRQDVWRRARSGELAIVVGARSAVFTPLPSLRLLVVDEEHEGAYKQAETPRYHAREVAIVRAHRAGATVVLGSATPALESYANVQRGKLGLLALPERIDARPRASVVVHDLRPREGAPKERTPILSRELTRKISERLSKKEQVILFLNRRGYAPFVQCRHCGLVARCHQCDVSLTFHRTSDSLVCHYCGDRKTHFGTCENCGSLRILFAGIGTQRVEEELQALFPRVQALRLDFDSTRRVGSYEHILRAFGAGEAEILLGTQMVARGLDFPNVTLVGVINADAGLNLPDFRSAERTFQLLTQVAGRAGRGERPGEVVLQTHYPEHYALTAAVVQDYEAFFLKEIALRREREYPPFTRMANLLFDGEEEARVIRAAEWLGTIIGRDARKGLTLLGPAPQPLSRLKGKHRWHLAIRAPHHATLRQACVVALEEWERTKREHAGVRMTIDMDPIDLL
jgi:primosomal protein N' (replication factor Y)